MIQARLIKLESTHSNIRTPETIGELRCLPEVGIPIILYSDPLTKGANIRIIQTTPAKRVEQLEGGSYIVTTSHSTYHLAVLNRKELKLGKRKT